MVSRLPSVDQRDVNLGTDASDVLSEFRVQFSLMFVLLQRAEEDAPRFSRQGAEEALEGSLPRLPTMLRESEGG